jgi:hypothetical protein
MKYIAFILPECNVVLTDYHIHLHFYVLPLMWETMFYTYIKREAELCLCILNVMCSDTFISFNTKLSVVVPFEEIIHERSHEICAIQFWLGSR